MKKFLAMLLLFGVAPVFATGVHVDEIEYQNLIDKMIGPMGSVIQSINRGEETYQNLVSAAAGKTTAQLCAQLFPTGACTSAGDAQYDITADLQAAGTALHQVYLCATGGTCTASDRFSDMQQFINVR